MKLKCLTGEIVYANMLCALGLGPIAPIRINLTYVPLVDELYFKIQVHAPQNLGMGHFSSLIEYEKLLWVLFVK